MRHGGVIVAVVLLCAACGAAASSVNPKEAGPCPPGREISGRQLRDALRQQGFSAVCLRGVYGAQLANSSPTGQGDKAQREGSVICEAHKFMPPRTQQHPHKVFEWGSVPTHSQPGRQLMLANVECVLYLDSATRRDAPARIRRAFETLAARKY